MKILEPNTGQEFAPIMKQHAYAFIGDTKQKFFLKEINIALGQHTWEWISLRSDRFIDIRAIGDRYCTFDNAINRAVNDPYCTVYEFDSSEEMIKNWNDIKYIDNIKTIYKGKG